MLDLKNREERGRMPADRDGEGDGDRERKGGNMEIWQGCCIAAAV